MAISSSSAASSLIERSVRTSRSNRETLGDRHADTLRSIHDTSGLLRYLGKLQEARPLLEEALKGQRETLGDRVHPRQPRLDRVEVVVAEDCHHSALSNACCCSVPITMSNVAPLAWVW